MTGVVARVRSLGWSGWGVFLRSLWLLPWCAWSLQQRGLAPLLEWSAPPAARLGNPTDELGRARHLARAVGLAALYGPYRANCLQRSLVLCRILRQNAIACELRFGAAQEPGCFSAHAWVEHRGVVINDGEDVTLRFTPLEQKGSRAD